MIKHNGIEYDDPFTTFDLTEKSEKEILSSLRSYYEKLGIEYLIKHTAPNRVKLLLNKEQNQRKWNSLIKCGDKIIKPPHPMFGEEMSKGSRTAWNEEKRVHEVRS